MEYLKRIFSLPILTKELIEQANRKQTYVFRVGFVLFFVLFFLYSGWDALSQSINVQQAGAYGYALNRRPSRLQKGEQSVQRQDFSVNPGERTRPIPK